MAPAMELLSCKFPSLLPNMWTEISSLVDDPNASHSCRAWTPRTEDVGRALRFECTPIWNKLGSIESAGMVTGLGQTVAFETQAILPCTDRSDGFNRDLIFFGFGAKVPSIFYDGY